MTELIVEHMTVKAGPSILVRDAGFTLRPGDFIALLGPNGAGKTSLIRAALGLHKAESGTAVLDGHATATLAAAHRARRLAYLPQTRPLAWPNRVADIVALGRFSHGAAMGRLGETDKQAVDRALAACDLMGFQDRHADTLSGGELARVHCARAFAAQAPLLIADEPIASLDPRHQFRILDLIKQFVEGGGGALVVLHDINLAARYASHLIWMKDGQIVAAGPPTETCTPALIRDVYGVDAHTKDGRIEMSGAL